MAVMDEYLLIATIPWTFNNYQEAREIIDTTGGEYYKKNSRWSRYDFPRIRA